MECRRLIKHLCGDTYPQGWLTSTLTSARKARLRRRDAQNDLVFMSTSTDGGLT